GDRSGKLGRRVGSRAGLVPGRRAALARVRLLVRTGRSVMAVDLWRPIVGRAGAGGGEEADPVVASQLERICQDARGPPLRRADPVQLQVADRPYAQPGPLG